MIRRDGAAPIRRFRFAQGMFMSNPNQLMVEEHVHGETVWVAVRARGADWSWLTPEEAVRLGRLWLEQYGSTNVLPAE